MNFKYWLIRYVSLYELLVYALNAVSQYNNAGQEDSHSTLQIRTLFLMSTRWLSDKIKSRKNCKNSAT